MGPEFFYFITFLNTSGLAGGLFALYKFWREWRRTAAKDKLEAASIEARTDAELDLARMTGLKGLQDLISYYQDYYPKIISDLRAENAKITQDLKEEIRLLRDQNDMLRAILKENGISIPFEKR